jgi:hypothetical protein
MVSYAETAEQPTALRDLYGIHDCIENAFSKNTIIRIYSALVNNGSLQPITIRTGGGRNGVAFPALQVMRGNHTFATIKANNQFKLSNHVGGQPALTEIHAYYASHPDMGNAPATLNGVNCSLANFMWRYTHRLPDDSFPLIPATAEISHLAEGYSAANRAAWGEAKVEYTQLESHDVNESRKTCSLFGLMWMKPGGEIIAEHEGYSGPSMCPHASIGSPCYAPYPAAWRTPTGETPNPRKQRRKSGGGGGDKKKQKPRKSGSGLAPGQRTIEFVK